MNILEENPWCVREDDALTPSTLNAIFGYAKACVDDVKANRYLAFPLVFSFVETTSSALTQASTTMLEFRFTPPAPMIVDRAFLHANLTSSAEVRVNIRTTGGATPDGVVTPWLSTGGAVAAVGVDTTDIATERFSLAANTTYAITVSTPVGGATFSLARFDVVLHMRVDRWAVSGEPVAEFVPFTEATGRDPDAVNAVQTAFTTNAIGPIATPIVDGDDGLPIPVLFSVPGLSSANTLLTDRRYYLPLANGSDAKQRLTHLQVFIAPNVAAGATTVTVNVLNAAGSTVGTASASSSGGTTAIVGGTLTALGISLNGTLAADPATVAKDFSLRFVSSSATACRRAWAVAWISR